MKLGLTGLLALGAIFAVPLVVTASPLQQRIAQTIHATSIGELQRANTVTLAGEVVQVRGDDFILRDATGQIRMEAESFAIRQANLKAGDQVTVAGYYDDDSFEVLSITPSNGEIIYVFDD